MRCDDVTTQLKTFMDAELPWLAALRIRHHLVHCTRCASHAVEWRQIGALLVANDLFAGSHLPVTAADVALKRRSTTPLKLLVGASAIISTIVLLLLPGRGRDDMSMASEVRQAMMQVKTWHFTGWKLQGKDKIPWEVWGRRVPYFYREQVGADVIVDDGTQRVSIAATAGG